MKNNNKRRAFTLVELLVVVAILAILASVSVIGYTSFTKKARLSNDIGLVTQLNTVLKAEEAAGSKNKTMHDAAVDIENAGYNIEKMTPTSDGYDILWDQVNDRFVLKDGNNVMHSDGENVASGSLLWEVVDEYDEASSYSQYLRDKDFANPTTFANVKTGIDLGNNKEKFELTYNGSIEHGKEVIIRTNGSESNLTINTKTSSVHHFGPLGNLNIEEVPTESYHENGKTVYATIAKGRIVVEEQSEVSVILVNNEGENANNTVVIEAPAETAKVENVYVAAPVKEESSNAQLVESLKKLENKAGENKPVVKKEEATTPEKIEEAVEEKKNNALAEENNADVSITNLETNKATYMTLSEFRDSVNVGTTYEGYSIALLKDIDLKNEAWNPIGTTSHPFKGKFNGNNRTITGLKLAGNKQLGLFGYVAGTTNPVVASQSNWSNIYNPTTNILKDDFYSEDQYTAAIVNLNIKDASLTIKTEFEGDRLKWANHGFGLVIGKCTKCYIENISIVNSTVSGHSANGLIVGRAENSALINLRTDNQSSIEAVHQDNSGATGGIVGYLAFNSIVRDCVNEAAINSNAYDPVGGFIGNSCGNLILCNNINKGNITLTDEICLPSYVGGLIGYSHTKSNNLVISCVNEGNIEGHTSSNKLSSMGGIIGAQDSGIISLYNCKNSGNINVSTSYCGHVGGWISVVEVYGFENTGSAKNNNEEVTWICGYHKELVSNPSQIQK